MILNRFISIVVSAIIILSIISPILSVAAPYKPPKEPWMDKVHPVFLKKLLSMSDDEFVTAVVRLKPLPMDVRARVRGNHDLAVATLKEWAKVTQAPIVRFVVDNGGVVLNTFWIDNAILVRVKVGLLKKIALLPDVVEIFENFRVHIIEPIKVTKVSPSQEVESWGIFRIHAPEVWAKGYTGEGIRICVLDTGVDITHPALAGKMLTLDPSNPYYPGGWMEFDENGNPVLSQPHDTHGHGTHTSGTALGGDTENILIGVAPGATLMHGLVLPGGGGSWAQVTAGMEWAVDPYYLDPSTGEPVPTGLPAHVVSMSWGADNYYGNELLPAIENMLLANVIPVAAAGNCGPGCTDNPGNIWGAFAVGATDEYDQVASWSSGAVVNWPDPPEEWPFFDIYPSTYIKPDFSAPGVDIVSSVPGGGYEAWQGTSMATPHVAGTVALILQAAGWTDFQQPDTPEMVYLILNATAEDFGDPGQDTRYGYGIVNALEAVNLAETYAKTTGVEGYVYDAVDHSPVPWATVTVNETGKTVRVNGSGYFKIPLDPGVYTLIFNAWGYEPQTLVVNVTVVNGTLAGFVYDQLYGTPIAGAAVTIEELGLTVYTNATGGFSISLPPGTYNVTASATGYTSETKSVEVKEAEVTIVTFELMPTANGTIYGYVFDADTGLPIEGATVWVETTTGVVANNTDSTGYYELNVPAGTYTVYAMAPGYIQNSMPDVFVEPGSSIEVNITLTPSGGEVVVVGNNDYDTEPHLADVVEMTGLPVVEFSSVEDLLSNWSAGLVSPKVIIIDHWCTNIYDDPSNETVLELLTTAEAEGVSLIFLSTPYSGTTGIEPLYDYRDQLQALGYPAPDDYEYHWPSAEYVRVQMLEPEHPIFNGVVPDEDDWFYLADLDQSYYTDYEVFWFEDDSGLGYVDLGLVVDDYNEVNGTGVGLWVTSTGVPWFYLGSWGESEYMQYLEPGGDGMYSNNTMTVLINAILIGYGVVPLNLPLDRAKEILGYTIGVKKSEEVKPSLYTFVEVYLNRLPYGWVKGKVVGNDGTVLAGATITVLGTPVSVKTDEDGQFNFWLPEGFYTLTISYPGYYSKVVNVTVVANETTDLDTITLLRQPRVAVLWDYSGEIKAFLGALGLYVVDYSDITQMTQDILTGFYDLVIYSGYYGVPFPSQTEFEEFINATESLKLPIIWLDNWGNYGYGIKVLSTYTGDPSGYDYSYGRGYVYVRVDQAHPIFRGYSVGDVIQLTTSTSSDFSWYTGFTGQNIGTIIAGGDEYGPGFGWKYSDSGAKWVLLSSLAPESWTDMSMWTPDAFQIFANAVYWALTKPLTVYLEETELHVGDTTYIHISGAPASTLIYLLLDGNVFNAVTSDPNGNATVEFTVPLIPGGIHVIEAVTEDGLYYGMAEFKVLPKIVAEPTETTSPGQVTITATGLGPRQTALVYIDANYITFIAANESGAFVAVINIPMVVTGVHALKLVDPATGEELYSLDIDVTSKLDEITEKLDVIILNLGDVNTSFIEKLGGIEGKIDQVIADLGTISSETDSISDKLNTLQSMLNSISGTVDSISGDIAYIKTNVGTLAADIDKLNATLVALITTKTGEVYALLNTSVGAITAKLDDLNELGVSISGDLSTALSKLDNIGSKLDTVSSDLSSVSSKVDEVKNMLTTLNSSLSDLKSIIESKASDVMNKLDSILSKLDQLSQDVSGLKTNVKTISEEKIPSLESKLEDTKGTASTASTVGTAGLGLAVVALAAALFGVFRKH